MRVTQLRIFALLLTKIAVILSSVAISTDHWYILSYSPTSSRLLKDKSYSIFYECSNGNCKSISTNEGKSSEEISISTRNSQSMRCKNIVNTFCSLHIPEAGSMKFYISDKKLITDFFD